MTESEDTENAVKVECGFPNRKNDSLLIPKQAYKIPYLY
jgi:hypothetical protein